MKRFFAVFLGLTAVPCTALAEPTIWQETRSPRLLRESEAMVESEKLLNANRTPEHPGLTPLDVKRALYALDDAGVAHSTNPAALYVMGRTLDALADVHLGSYDAADAYLLAVARADVSGLMKSVALFDLAMSAIRARDFKKAIAYYDDALAESPMTAPHVLFGLPTRDILLANQAEAFMAMGDIPRAVDGYRAAVAAAPSYVSAPTSTTLFSLGVALDRSGDLEGGLEAVELAHKYDPDDKTIRGPNWSFVPTYDADWYWGLESLLAARRTDDPEVKAKSYAEAIDHFATYVANAPEKDPYVSIARGHLVSLKKEAGKAEPMHTSGSAPTSASR
jgi:tetratricopeptide (TPR) repeat protein